MEKEKREKEKMEAFKKKSTKQLQKERKNATGDDLRIIQEILLKRGALEEHPSEGGMIANMTLTEEDIPLEGESPLIEEEDPQPEVKEKEDPQPEVKEEEDPKPEVKEEVDSTLEKYKKNKGKIITFVNKKGETVSGPISSVRYDKRSGMIFYMVNTGTGLFGKSVWSEDYQITEK